MNSSLEDIVTHCSESTEDGLIAILNVLKDNSTLRRLSVEEAEEPNQKLKTAWENMLRHNLVLSNVWEELEDPMILFYLKLNCAGRIKVIDRIDATEEDWLAVLENSDGDLDCLYCFLRANPTLCTCLNAIDQSEDTKVDVEEVLDTTKKEVVNHPRKRRRTIRTHPL